MSDSRPDRLQHPTVQEMADALRYHARTGSRSASYVATMDGARFQELANIEGLPPLARPRLTAPVVKVFRGIFQIFLRPWLATQTIFNQEIARRVDHTLVVAGDLDRRMPHLEQSMQAIEKRLQRLEEDVRTRAAGPAHAWPPSSLDAGALLEMFVHSRLPRPPARVLNLDEDATRLVEALASFGFDVETVNAASASAPRGGATADRTGGPLPFAPETFHAVVGRRPIEPVEIARVLKPGGRLLTLHDRAAGPTGTTGDAASPVRLGPLEVVEMLLAEFDGTRWSVRPEGIPATGQPPFHVAGILLIDARRPDVSGR
jgi:hypothetical protein